MAEASVGAARNFKRRGAHRDNSFLIATAEKIAEA